MNKKMVIGAMLLLLPCFLAKSESFVVKKKKTKDSGKKIKKNICRGFARCGKTCPELIEKIARIARDLMEKVEQYFEGQDPFCKLKKSEAQEIIRLSENLEKEMTVSCKQCDAFSARVKKLLG